MDLFGSNSRETKYIEHNHMNKFYKNRLFLVFFMLFFLQVDRIYGQDSIEVYISDFSQHEIRQKMESNASHFLSELNLAWSSNKQPEPNENWLSSSYHEDLIKMWQTAPFYVPEDVIIQPIIQQVGGFYEMRNIPLYFLNDSETDEEGEQVYEEGVIRFNPSGLIVEFRIGLPIHRYQSLIQQSKDSVDGENREMILSFIETFRTSYNKKDIDFIESVFSEEALIIVGRVVEATGEESVFEQQVEYLQFNKENYIERLRTIFYANTWIDVNFEDIQIDRHPKHQNMYGVYLTQNYRSSIYSDTGFLFLLIDFRKQEEPMIHVRTWEPKSEVHENNRFQMGSIEIF